jgi:hypothetical protein
MGSNTYDQIIIVDSFSSVFLDSINNETIEYDSSEMESIRFSSVDKDAVAVSTIDLNRKDSKNSFSFVRCFLCKFCNQNQ